MDLETKKKDDIVFLKPLRQNIDATASPQFRERVMDLIKQGNNFFLLDLSGVDFVDSSGLGTMVSILKTLKLNNGEIVLCNLSAAVSNLFSLTRMNNVFNICSNADEGLAQLIDKRKNL